MKLFYVLFLSTLSYFSQNKIELSDHSTISILTCGPGSNELYSSFGHNAIRVKDKSNNIDKVYNYGTFDFDTPNFYLKFCQGKLLYQLSSYDFKYFPYSYYKENRWIKSQTLNFSKNQNQKLFEYLEWNALPENKNYHYDFFNDNCATKMYEVIEKSIGHIHFKYNEFPVDLTHRDLIHLYLEKNSWAKFGIDLALGAVIDKKATLKQYLFLPDYIYSGFKNSSINNVKSISKENYILPDYKIIKNKSSFFISPLFFSLLFLITTLFICFKNLKGSKNILIIPYGIIGFIITFLWFLTEHSATKINMNILWASPILLVYPFFNTITKKVFSYVGLLQIAALAIISILGFQEFNIPIYILALSISAIYIKEISLLTSKV